MPKDHYVPQSILKNFSPSHQPGKVFFFQKNLTNQSMEVKMTHVKNICNEKGFFSLKIPDSLDSGKRSQTNNFDYDKIFTKLDSDIAPIVKQVINDNSIDKLNCQQTKTLAEYVVFQYLRTPAAKKAANHAAKKNAKNLNSLDEQIARLLQTATLLDEVWINDISNILIQGLILKLIPPSNAG